MQARMERFIADCQRASTLDALQSTVTNLRDDFGAEHVVYHAVNASGGQYAALTYDPEWVSRYVEQDYARIDPVVQGCLRRFNAVDWKDLEWSGRGVRQFLAEAREAGVGNQGFSVPIRGPNGQFALFTVNHSCTDATWSKYT